MESLCSHRIKSSAGNLEIRRINRIVNIYKTESLAIRLNWKKATGDARFDENPQITNSDLSTLN